jgi:uncharacterized membrane protein
MEAPLIVGIVFFSVVTIVKIVVDSSTRRRMLETGTLDDRTKRLMMSQAELSTLSNLKWGMILIGIGLAALLSQLMPYSFSDEGAIGLVFLFAGLGFLIYYPIAQKRLKEIEQRNDSVDSQA